MTKRVLSIVCVFVVCACLVIPCFASSSVSEPLEVSTSSATPTYLCNNNINAYVMYSEGNNTVYCCAYWSDSTILDIVFGSSSSFQVRCGGTSYYSASDSGYYFANRPQGGVASSTVSASLPVLSSMEECKNFLLNGGSSSDVSFTDYTLVLNPGNVAFIKLDSSSASFKLSSNFFHNSNLLGSRPWANDNRYYGYRSALPSGSGSLSTSDLSLVDWNKSASGQNILGQSTFGGKTISVSGHSGQYFVLYNPIYDDGYNAVKPDEHQNYPVNVFVDSASEIKVYQLQSTYSNGSLTADFTGESYDQTLDELGNPGGWVDQSGNPSTGPVTGGANTLPGAASILDILENFFSGITNMFNTGFSAIRTLVGGASDFVENFSALYSWLPASVMSILTSAIILAITIGVLKVFF